MAAPITIDTPLTDAERLFVAEYLIDDNATRAYRAIHPDCTYRTARSEGSRFVAKPNIREEIRAARAIQLRDARITADRVLEELARIAFADYLLAVDRDTGNLLEPHRIPIQTRRAIKSVTVTRVRTTTRNGTGNCRVTTIDQIVKYEFHDKQKALETLCKYLKLTDSDTSQFEHFMNTLPPEAQEKLRKELAASPTPKNRIESVPSDN